MSDHPSRLELLPDELLLDLFEYVDIRDLYDGFWGLNSRLNNLLLILKNLSLIITGESLLISLFARQIIRLVVNTWDMIDLSLFPNLCSLTLNKAAKSQLNQIRPGVMPNLVYLSLSSTIDCLSAFQLAQDIFSNRFSSLRHADLGFFSGPYFPSWSQAPYLRSICVSGSDPIIIPLILASCPHLHNLQVHIFENKHIIASPSSRSDHPLQRFLLLDPWGKLSFGNVDILLTHMPNIEQIYVEFFCTEPFIRLAETLSDRLKRLRRFDCDIIQSSEDNEIVDSDTIRQVHSCFHRVQHKENPLGHRIFTENLGRNQRAFFQKTKPCDVMLRFFTS